MKWTNRVAPFTRVAYGLVATATILFSLSSSAAAQIVNAAGGERAPYVDSGIHNLAMTWIGSVPQAAKHPVRAH
jgi:hypothetical protein